MNNKIRQLTTSSMCLALGVIIPQVFHIFPGIGNIILPMHIPVLVCGFICGPLYGLLVGLITPFLSHLIFQMPSSAMLIQMLVELGIYGLSTGIFNKVINMKNVLLKNYIVLIISMLIGRIAYGLLNALIINIDNYSLTIWLNAAFITSLPGIIIQLLFVPSIVKLLKEHYLK